MKPKTSLTPEQVEALEKFIERCNIKKLRRKLNFTLFQFAGLGEKSPIPLDITLFQEYAELNNLLENVGEKKRA